jgi:hypothetical protein
MIPNLNDENTAPPKQTGTDDLAARLQQIGAHCAALPDIDPRMADVGYDETGMWSSIRHDNLPKTP